MASIAQDAPEVTKENMATLSVILKNAMRFHASEI
jgi:hypothetical protein